MTHLPNDLIAAAFIASLFTVQWLQFKLTSRPADPQPSRERPTTVEVAMPDDLRKFFALSAA